MIVFLNGKFIPEEKATVSVMDRGFLYGDGLFEGLLIKGGRPFRWAEHMVRLARGVEFLKLTMPSTPKELRRFALELVKRNQLPDCILRISLSRGITARGYSPKNAVNPAVVMTLHPLPVSDGKQIPRWQVITASFRLPVNDPLTRFKTANKLPQVLARAEADEAVAQEAILLNTDGYVAEGTTSNIFWVEQGVICTTPLPSGALPGVTRATILELCASLKLRCREKTVKPEALHRTQGAFLTMTSMGVVEIDSLDGRPLRRSPLVKKLAMAYRKMI
ncbi:MAG TPA: aminotransferase class IV [Verrucomicrobiae bacterium]|jgi:aminodeoxychorismate lyase|nr:aminotransferase class IV [Verrucomicrobiae bacterium]